MTEKRDDSSDFYRQYRELTSQERDTSNAIDRFKNNRVSSNAHQQQIKRIMALIPDGLEPEPESFAKKSSKLFSWLTVGPVVRYAMLFICTIGVFSVLTYQKPYSWTTLVPASVVEAGLKRSISKSIGSTTQMGFTAQGSELASHYSLGRSSTQLAVSLALKDESLLPFFATAFKRLESGVSSPEVTNKVKELGELVSRQSEDRAIGDSIAELQQAVQQTSKAPVNGFALGQQIESLRLALVIAEDKDDLTALKEVSAGLFDLKLDQWHSAEVPALNKILTRIHALSQSNLLLDERRQLQLLIQQLNLLLT